ncbi:hypothetical protein SASPL_135105 [Salvia splendens]|uniref:Farnesol kinase n=1 Tax=Salvia splendens TaxID=180675 RepID=A0A8X8WXJ1_SALSN|nr:farnesol kinase, chloroplastic-like [Salvia splendens]KAG6402891.1 hypothetical protein SASPL_135105 [Salvia splendens]
MFSDNVVISNIIAGGLSAGITGSVLKLLEITATRGVFDQKLNRKLVHISFGLVFMLCWPLFSSGCAGAVVASLIPGMNVVNMLLLGSGIRKDDATVKSMTRTNDHRELLKGPLCYISVLTLVTAFYWRTSPIAIAVFCNVCAGDGMADIFGRRFGRKKLPYNRDKSVAGTVAMACAGFLASVGYMLYFSGLGYIEASFKLVTKFLVVSIASALVESHPKSTQLDDNFTVPLAVFLFGTLLF